MVNVAIVVPLYKIHPSTQEILAINNNFKILKNYPKYIIAPLGLITDEYGDILKSSKIIYFSSKWFKNLNSYNRLMLTKKFYKLFINYKYILIIQPDALVFRDELIDWCTKGYSYIGAPWPQGRFLHPYSFYGHKLISKLFPFLNKPKKCYVGNGGLSLRNIKESILILQKHFLTVKLWSINEDGFWAYYFMSNDGNCLMPSEIEASKFSLELEAEQYYMKNECKLPFGCHAYEKDNVFWNKVLLKDGIFSIK